MNDSTKIELTKEEIAFYKLREKEAKRLHKVNSAIHKEYYIENAEDFKQKARQWRIDNPERERKTRSEYYYKNRKRILLRQRKYREERLKNNKINKVVPPKKVRKLKLYKTKQEIRIIKKANKKDNPVLMCAYQDRPCFNTCSYFRQARRGNKIFCGMVEIGQLV